MQSLHTRVLIKSSFHTNKGARKPQTQLKQMFKRLVLKYFNMGFLKIKLRTPPEEKVLNLIEKHLSFCVSASEELGEAAKAKINKEQTWMPHLERLYDSEEKADSVRRELVGVLAAGILPPLSKGDLMQLTAKLDMVADWSKEAGRILEILPVEDLPHDMGRVFVSLVEETGRCVHALSTAIDSLYTDHEKSLEQCDRVEEIEHLVDSIFIESMKTLFESEMSPQFLLLLNTLVNDFEMVSDTCEDTADMIRVVIISTFH
jgi:predicted phosphate transport protein (TIGR00153 family)